MEQRWRRAGDAAQLLTWVQMGLDGSQAAVGYVPTLGIGSEHCWSRVMSAGSQPESNAQHSVAFDFGFETKLWD